MNNEEVLHLRRAALRAVRFASEFANGNAGAFAASRSIVGGLWDLDAFAVFLRWERSGIPFLLGRETGVWQSGWSKRKGFPFDFVATFLATVDEHELAILNAAQGLVLRDPDLEWFRTVP